MDQHKINQILRIAKMHYELKMSQVEIAEKENLSKSKVSRLLKAAMDMGFIKVSIIEPLHSFSDLEAELLSRFRIKKAIIVPDMVGSPQVVLRDVCAALADDLPRMVEDDGVIGVAWGRTLSTFTASLPEIKRRGVSVFQFNGGFSRALWDTDNQEIVRRLAESLGARGYLFPAPAIVDSSDIADTIKNDSSIARIAGLAGRCQTAIYSAGAISHDSVLYQMGYFTPETYAAVEEKAAADICSHFIDDQGNIADPELDSRVMAVPLEVIRAIPNKLLIASGPEKARPVLACLRGGLVDTLYIDEPTVSALLKLDKPRR